MAKDFQQHTMFCLGNRDGEAYVKVTNTKLKVTTFWALDDYQQRLDKMRDLYVTWDGAGALPEGVEQLFFDPNDTWHQEASFTTPTRRTSGVQRPHSFAGMGEEEMAPLAALLDGTTLGLSSRDRLEGRNAIDGVQLRQRHLGDAKVSHSSGHVGE